ncbi:hypothetical protein [uncultured Winogradskyella sp.]|uniref:hypothetical protein n=1 Tax=uncultured Winogradskyella sp. TaxID=395353 RepID=UPI002607DED7|nr:hypothetical protein [uncultured Winogradskyella sp.]
MIEAGYILLTLFMSIIVLYIFKYALKKIGKDSKTTSKNVTYLALGLIIWLVYVYLISMSGLLENFSLPPRFPIFVIFPLFIFTGIVLYKNRNSMIFTVIPESWAIYLQTFRIFVELLFVATVGIGFLHPEVTIEGYNYDMVFAFTAPIIGYLVFNSKKLNRKVALLWNYIGLAVLASIIALFVTTIFIPSLWGSQTSLAPIAIVKFPYLLVAGFLMPLAVFVHVFSIIQLSRTNNTKNKSPEF